jgi:hypothetical protein
VFPYAIIWQNIVRGFSNEMEYHHPRNARCRHCYRTCFAELGYEMDSGLDNRFYLVRGRCPITLDAQAHQMSIECLVKGFSQLKGGNDAKAKGRPIKESLS